MINVAFRKIGVRTRRGGCTINETRKNLVAMISVACVHPIGLCAVEAASSRIAVAPFGKILSRDATS